MNLERLLVLCIAAILFLILLFVLINVASGHHAF